MNLFLQKILLGCCCLLLLATVNAQVNVSLSVSPPVINKDEAANIKIIVENSTDIQQVTAPSLKKFIVLSGPDPEKGSITINGQMTSYVALSFIVKPKVTGRINIDAATLKIAGKQYKTNTGSIMVNNATGQTNSPGGIRSLLQGFDPVSAEPPPAEFNDYIFHKGDKIDDKVNRNMFLKLEVDKTSCYVGEPIVATYKLYTRLKSESKLSKNPSFNGFSVIDLTNSDISTYTREKLNGREYNVYIIRKAQLYPLQPGSIELESAELDNNIQFIKDEYVNRRGANVTDLMDDFTQATVPEEGIIHQTVNLKSNPLNIEVKPLPELNKPVSFTGAVGKFSLDAVLQKNSFPVNEPGKLLVRVRGSGNLPLLTIPVLEWPAGIDPFEPKVSESLNKNAIPVTGYKVFEYSFSVDSLGQYSLPAINFSYFDPVAAAYKTISTKPFPFTVTKATATVPTDNMVLNKREEVTGINKIFNNRWWIIVFIGIAVLTGLFIWARKDKTADKVSEPSPQMKQEDQQLESIVATSAINQQNPLERTEACLYLDNCTGFYSLLNTELKTFLAKKFAVDPIHINNRNIATVMDKKNISNDTVLQLQKLLGEIEWQLYTPFERNEQMNRMYQEAQDIVQLINTYSFTHL